MGTFPTAYEYGRPTPEPSGNAGVAPAPQQSTVAAQTQIELGAGQKQVAENIDEVALHYDTLMAQDATNRLRAQQADLTYGPQNGFMNLKGGDVLKRTDGGQPMMEAFPVRLQAAADDIGRNLFGRARELYMAKAPGVVESYKLELLKHTMAQMEVYNKNVFAGTIKQAETDAVRLAGDPAGLQGVADRVAIAGRNFAKSQGLEVEPLVAELQSNVYKNAIQATILTGDTQASINAFQRYRGKLDGRDLLAIGSQVKTMQQNQDARGDAMYFMSGGGPTSEKEAEGVKTSMGFWTTPNAKGEKYNNKVAAGITAGFLAESRFFPGARAIRDGNDGSDSINIGQWNSARAKAFEQFAASKGLDPTDVKTGLLYARAEIDGEIPYSVSGLSPEFKARLMNAKDEKEAADIMTRGYFRPKFQDRDSAIRQGHASAILAKYTPPDPLATAVNQATLDGAPVDPQARENGPQYVDPDKLELASKARYDKAMLANQAANANEPGRMAAVKDQLDMLLAGQMRQVEQIKLDYKIKLDTFLKTGGGVDANGQPLPPTSIEQIPPALWNTLSRQDRTSVIANLKKNVKGEDPPFTLDAKRRFMELSDMATNEPDRFREIDLNREAPTMPAAQLLQLQTLKNGIQKAGQVEYSTTTALSMADKSLSLQGVDTRTSGASDADVAVRQAMHAKLLDWLSRYHLEKKRAPTDSEVRQKIDDMLILGRTATPGFMSRVPGFREPRAFVGPPNAQGAVGTRGSERGEVFKFQVNPQEAAKFYVPYARIPPDVRQGIEERLKAKGGIPQMRDAEGNPFDDTQGLQREVERSYAKMQSWSQQQGARKK